MSRESKFLERHGWRLSHQRKDGMVKRVFWVDPQSDGTEAVPQGWAMAEQQLRNRVAKAAEKPAGRREAGATGAAGVKGRSDEVQNAH